MRHRQMRGPEATSDSQPSHLARPVTKVAQHASDSGVARLRGATRPGLYAAIARARAAEVADHRVRTAHKHMARVFKALSA